ncbi:hypothetical protein P3X46_029485 [Hevea brasiliensis]|uniref:Uncharacterized protein n=1 Tax=Hevea brasiliensis TaxID=3981 RepID=A0ABQ9KSB7_HEVBR|nr:uncharacterized protein LOC131174574 isoform X2 [Hevea brasiliensis]KAJ9147308.1 hypothetical protein P3X46_029485 [Hevea brasiliensis]
MGMAANFRPLFRRSDRRIGNPRPPMDSRRRDLRDRTGPAPIEHRLKKAIIGRSRSLGAIGSRIAHRRRDCIFKQIRLPDGQSQNVVNITVNPSIFRRSGRVPGVRIGIGDRCQLFFCIQQPQ